MFGMFDGIQKAVENVIDVGIGVATMGEHGNISKQSVSKMVADGIEIALIASAFNVGVDIVEKLIEED